LRTFRQSAQKKEGTHDAASPFSSNSSGGTLRNQLYATPLLAIVCSACVVGAVGA
jgi:hypothetical protein